jgi:hypothetical protein
MIDPGAYSSRLWLFTVLLFLRVIGQVIVVRRAPRWLPPMVWICLDFSRGAGMFVQSYPGRGNYVVGFGWVYLCGMVLRYIMWMWRRPDQRWLGGTIPIIFHSIVALFIITFGSYHLRLAG